MGHVWNVPHATVTKTEMECSLPLQITLFDCRPAFRFFTSQLVICVLWTRSPRLCAGSKKAHVLHFTHLVCGEIA